MERLFCKKIRWERNQFQPRVLIRRAAKVRQLKSKIYKVVKEVFSQRKLTHKSCLILSIAYRLPAIYGQLSSTPRHVNSPHSWITVFVRHSGMTNGGINILLTPSRPYDMIKKKRCRMAHLKITCRVMKRRMASTARDWKLIRFCVEYDVSNSCISACM